jgi:hypothetical protein
LARLSSAIGGSVDGPTFTSIGAEGQALPMPGGLIVSGAGHTVARDSSGVIHDTVIVASTTPYSRAQLEAFTAERHSGWSTATFEPAEPSTQATITSTDGTRRLTFWLPNLEGLETIDIQNSQVIARMQPPSWVGTLAVPIGGELVEVDEAVGQVMTSFIGPRSGFVFARWQYPASAHPALMEFLSGDAVNAAGFTVVHKNLDHEGGMVDVEIGDWVGSIVMLRSQRGDTYDLGWQLDRA